MPKVNVSKAHNTTLDEAIAKTREFVAAFHAKNAALISEIKWAPDGRSANRKGSMFTGCFTVDEQKVNCLIDLSFMASAFKGTVEEKLKRQLDKAFPS